MKFLILLTALLLVSNANAQVPWDIQSDKDFTEPLDMPVDEFEIFKNSGTSNGIQLDYPYHAFSEDMLNTDWMQTFDVVIVGNRAISGASMQTLKLYSKGQRFLFENALTGEISDTVKISSGGIFNGRSATPVGYFSPTFLSPNHVASKSGSPMPFATFFIGGYAIHRVPYLKQEELLGQAVSAGCLRVSKDYVPQIFQLVEEAGQGQVAQFTRSGVPVRDEQGNLKMKRGFKTLVIVEDRVN